MENPQTNAKLLFSHQPDLGSFLFKLILVIPILMIPASIAICFEEGKNLMRLFAVAGAGIGGWALLYLLLKGVNSFIKNKCSMKIWDNKILEMKRSNNLDKFDLTTVWGIDLNLQTLGQVHVKIKMKDDQDKKLLYPGVLSNEDLVKLNEALDSVDIELTLVQ